MTQLSPSLRKAAVLIATLDDSAAEVLLQQMAPDEAAKVRRTLVALDDIPADEEQHVVAEFLRQQGGGLANSAGDDEVMLEIGRSGTAPSADDVEASFDQQTIDPMQSLFSFLTDIDPTALADVLRHEH